MSQLYEACKQCPRDPHLGIISSPPIHGITADNPSFTLQQPTTAAEKYIWIRLIYPIWQFYYFVRDNICLFFYDQFYNPALLWQMYGNGAVSLNINAVVDLKFQHL